ncbi:benenodin family lasso peptide [Sphingomonas sp. R-74633]|nr:benenodin family lasso peptide [Sphingomonas sp. R-74633]NYT41052.1 benenodin family lasso peptide [Sphingomonas sp. R-74633]
MQTEHDQAVDLIDLGAASTETQGSIMGTYDTFGLIEHEGLSDD